MINPFFSNLLLLFFLFFHFFPELYENHKIDQNRKPRKRIGYTSSVRNSQNPTNRKLNSSTDDKMDNDRNRSNHSAKSVYSLISTASTKGVNNKKMNSGLPNIKYKKYVYDKKYEEKPQSLKDLEKKHNYANKESGYVSNFMKPDTDIDGKQERIKMLNVNLKGNYGSKFTLQKNKL